MDLISFDYTAMLSGLLLVLDIELIMTVIVAVCVGLVFGAMPGITTSLCLTLFFPIALSLSTSSGFMLLLTLYSSTIVGAGAMAILFNIPGNPGAIASTFDGYPMSCSGKSYLALGIHLFSSTAGSLISWLLILAFFVPLSYFASKLGSTDVLFITLLVIVLVGIMGQGQLIKSFFSGLLGLMISVNNVPFNQGEPVDILFITYGDTLPLVIILVGLFSAPELYKLSRKKTLLQSEQNFEETSYRQLFNTSKILFTNKMTVTRASITGLIVGLLPSAGAALSSMTAYFIEKKANKNQANFGHGEVAGVIAPESANNASVAGSMLVLLLLGIPGSNSSAVIFGYLIEKGVPIGNQLYEAQSAVIYAVIFGGILSTIILAAVSFSVAPYIARLVNLNNRLLLPILISLVCFSAYFYRGYMGDVIILCLFGVVGFVMNKYKFPVISLVLGLFLGKQFVKGIEDVQASLLSGHFSLFDKPFSLVLATIILFLLFKHCIKWRPNR
ncbi:tripartite tricarboxylate transporter TctA [Vibrio sp. MACH09]|uniref:tripartite tricarboxylate transporter permease n=1 Tax=Vibrio sp. MACH09 TaxID=3025122 RepID=UPI00278D9D31|nr:tripartite tricarboxylate transporter permease [Vibrio sp. MACH09]GLO63540.1 tripartite tricarboxylate transporter TctA [Vibrio sp. MACH09]